MDITTGFLVTDFFYDYSIVLVMKLIFAGAAAPANLFFGGACLGWPRNEGLKSALGRSGTCLLTPLRDAPSDRMSTRSLRAG
jgi:hypothetical protein